MSERIDPFALRGVESQALSVAIGNEHICLPAATDRDGYFESRIKVADRHLEANGDCQPLRRSVRFRVFLERDSDISADGEALLIEPHGISIVSDIDDTIKQTEMSDRQRLIENTFLREFRAIDGMADVYHRWHQAGAMIHYVSLSPRPLYEPLVRFVDTAGFPAGSLHLRRFRFRDQALKRMVSRHQSAHKEREIRTLLRSFPHRKFVLVGDDADRDPELYSSIVEDHSDQVASIFLRHTSDPGAGEIQRRLGRAAGTRTLVFRDPRELPHQL